MVKYVPPPASIQVRPGSDELRETSSVLHLNVDQPADGIYDNLLGEILADGYALAAPRARWARSCGIGESWPTRFDEYASTAQRIRSAAATPVRRPPHVYGQATVACNIRFMQQLGYGYIDTAGRRIPPTHA